MILSSIGEQSSNFDTATPKQAQEAAGSVDSFVAIPLMIEFVVGSSAYVFIRVVQLVTLSHVSATVPIEAPITFDIVDIEISSEGPPIQLSIFLKVS